jgi:nitric oxide synthase oxygenase domain/subunit
VKRLVTDRQSKVFLWTTVLLTIVLVLVSVGCGIGEERCKLLQSDVHAISEVAIDNPKCTDWDKHRLEWHRDRVIRQIGELK